MNAPISARKTLLKITQFVANDNGTITLKPSNVYTVLLNPAEFSEICKIEYDQTSTMGQPAAKPRFVAVPSRSLSLSITLDGTGVVPSEGAPKEVRDQLKALKDVVFVYVGDRHEPSLVQIVWGALLFKGRLENMAVQYTLFKPSGEPLRAKLKLDFISWASNPEAERKADARSPDLSHHVLVRDGDTLPLLCDRIYGDSGYYLDVARYNGLTDFRRLRPGDRLHFPPLV